MDYSRNLINRAGKRRFFRDPMIRAKKSLNENERTDPIFYSTRRRETPRDTFSAAVNSQLQDVVVESIVSDDGPGTDGPETDDGPETHGSSLEESARSTS